MTFDSNPHNVIPVAIAGAVNALKATYTEPGVKRFVFTSSSTSVVISKRDTPGIVVTEETWNEDSIKQAWADPPYGPERSSPVYAASKTQAEQEVWKFHKENQQKRPDLVVNTGTLFTFADKYGANSIKCSQTQTSARASILLSKDILVLRACLSHFGKGMKHS